LALVMSAGGNNVTNNNGGGLIKLFFKLKELGFMGFLNIRLFTRLPLGSLDH